MFDKCLAGKGKFLEVMEKGRVGKLPETEHQQIHTGDRGQVNSKKKELIIVISIKVVAFWT